MAASSGEDGQALKEKIVTIREKIKASKPLLLVAHLMSTERDKMIATLKDSGMIRNSLRAL